MFVSSLKFRCWNLTPNVIAFGGGTFGKYLGHESGVLKEGCSAPIRETQRAPSPLPSCEDTAKRLHPWTKKRVLAIHRICQHLDLGLPSLCHYDKWISVVSKPPSLLFCYGRWKKKKKNRTNQGKPPMALYSFLKNCFIHLGLKRNTS